MEDKHSVTSKVLATIEEKGGNVSFNELEESTGLNFTELSTAIGQLVKESRLLMRVNHFAKDVCPTLTLSYLGDWIQYYMSSQ